MFIYLSVCHCATKINQWIRMTHHHSCRVDLMLLIVCYLCAIIFCEQWNYLKLNGKTEISKRKRERENKVLKCSVQIVVTFLRKDQNFCHFCFLCAQKRKSKRKERIFCCFWKISHRIDFIENINQSSTWFQFWYIESFNW